MDMVLSDSDWDSYSETGSNEDQEGNEYFYGGHASSLLSSLEASIGKIDDFLSFERGFIYGDIVSSVRDPSGQMGKVVGIKMSVDLESVNGNMIKNVNPKNLSKIRPISVGDYVVCGPWLGRVDRVVDCVAVVFDDGTECVVTAVDPEKLVPVSPNILEDPQYPYYPGQRVKVRLSTVSKSSRWFCGNWRENQDEGTVCSLEGGLMYVDWLASVLVGCGSNFRAPPHLLDSKKLTLVSCFSHANWQLGDWCMLAIAECKGFSEQAFHRTSTCELTNKQNNSERGFKRRNPKSKIEEIFVISKTKTKVDVLWQDGSQSLEVDSQTLVPVSVVNDHEFWPEQFVLEKGTYDDPNLFSSQRWGVVRGVDAKERTVKVQWKTITAPETNNLEEEQMEEVVSAYELVEHPDYSYCFGDYVFRMVQNQFDEQADKNYPNTRSDMTEEVALEEKNFSGDQADFTDKSYLPCIGNVLGFIDGAVEVRWATGITNKVAPCEIFRFDKHEGSAAIPVEDDTEELNKEIIQHEKQPNNEEGKDSLNLDDAAKSCKPYTSESSSYFLPQAAIGFFSSIAVSLFGSHSYTSLSGPSPSVCTSEVGKESGISHEKGIVETRDVCTEPHSTSESDIIGNENLNHEGEDIEGNRYLPCLKDKENADQFRQFDMLADCADHHFHSASKELALSQVKRGWMKKVQQEWSILEKDLPEQIYVRAFEERMDLLRAAIVGTPGTPYHDGLFFFDIYLPPEYPHEPPMVHYISGGLRVNPNLYESGKVCLSLLNTWTGTGSEVWNPGSSTILQVLLSLQALVLNDRPYFNEAGYDQQVGRTEGEKNSVSYNENAFLMTCKSMLFSLQKPPKHFEGLVMEHFTQRSENILMACKAYMEGVPIGCAVDFQKTDDKEGSSTGFKIMLAKLFQKLMEAFSAKGIDCNQFIAPGK
ncbi:probable ubiquitin-conjugating enzyme E2 24 [Rosa rugosa]|uniref:probable ubiquitin-conjugating enzyme E2 24 n=1 Tax=Rosa rugosa TaxID=74645 RepID=UPI002B405993|nr:probable ubiquitin-conjugating enzyme E2 24 [Rosa rugosa]